nr:V-type ATP synthase subunit F [uncultured Solibaculum sp.]
MDKIGVIGDYDSICGYSALGLDIFPVTEAGEASAILRKLAASGYAILYVTEQLFGQIRAAVDRYKDDYLPAIIPIPGQGGSSGIGMELVNQSVERAVGSDILS